MDKVTIIIPIHNLLKRGLKRVRNSVLSLNIQKDHIDDIIIVNSSNKNEFDMLNNLLFGLDIIHLHYPSNTFNKPQLLNIGIKASKSKYVLCTDADYLFRYDFLTTCLKYRSEKSILFKQVNMLPNLNITDDRVKSWNFPKSPLNQWGTLANGGCQYATKDFFIANPYPEEMQGFGAMDNIMAYIAYNKGLSIKWIKESEIFHQKHPIENKIGGKNKALFEKNQRILADYIKTNNLPILLTKKHAY